MSNTLFDDIFNITDVDAARYNKVSRINGTSSTSSDIKITLDINSDLFPVTSGEALTITLASSLALDDKNKDTTGSWRAPKAGEKSLADDYDYVMYGTVYKFEEGSDDKM
ncbi:DNA-directed RNA polymerase [Wickerhamomyces ciferrii]|uniref:DNA-directed RNA polymerase n=1 Tax=Wickerhamomyces ciferrii (strain ATCC 14091 / BCRC 22168 / CBS 111 / JCM 3599 / NBRC 0793 / NRRL Y-1031 F-60-10) TaxID=1206466 RepID=K0KSE3_WICCF|nr:DNA-directed RNA polymerase [Wickerhamomyces ciferrii]CCH44248.1 DNA-directed RNA polymerase [Wickerhamomyces ciferrii]